MLNSNYIFTHCFLRLRACIQYFYCVCIYILVQLTVGSPFHRQNSMWHTSLCPTCYIRWLINKWILNDGPVTWCDFFFLHTRYLHCLIYIEKSKSESVFLVNQIVLYLITHWFTQYRYICYWFVNMCCQIPKSSKGLWLNGIACL